MRVQDYSRRADMIWWLAECVLLHGRVPSAEAIRDRWQVSRATAWRYYHMAEERLEMLRARQGKLP